MSGIILGIDPGQTTGFAVVSAEAQFLASWEAHGDPKYGHGDIIRWLHIDAFGSLAAVVVEDYLGGGRQSAPGRFTTLLVGMVEGFCYAKEIPCFRQPNQMREPCLEHARKLCKLIGTTSPHERDAIAHAYAYLERRT